MYMRQLLYQLGMTGCPVFVFIADVSSCAARTGWPLYATTKLSGDQVDAVAAPHDMAPHAAAPVAPQLLLLLLTTVSPLGGWKLGTPTCTPDASRSSRHAICCFNSSFINTLASSLDDGSEAVIVITRLCVPLRQSGRFVNG